MRDYINEIAIRAVMWAWRFWLALWGGAVMARTLELCAGVGMLEVTA